MYPFTTMASEHTIYLTRWPLEDIANMLRLQSINSCCRLGLWAILVKLTSSECRSTHLIKGGNTYGISDFHLINKMKFCRRCFWHVLSLESVLKRILQKCLSAFVWSYNSYSPLHYHKFCCSDDFIINWYNGLLIGHKHYLYGQYCELIFIPPYVFTLSSALFGPVKPPCQPQHLSN